MANKCYQTKLIHFGSQETLFCAKKNLNLTILDDSTQLGATQTQIVSNLFCLTFIHKKYFITKQWQKFATYNVKVTGIAPAGSH